MLYDGNFRRILSGHYRQVGENFGQESGEGVIMTLDKPIQKKSKVGKIYGQQLTPQQRLKLKEDIFKLGVLSGVSNREIAIMTGYSLETVCRWAKEVYKDAAADFEEHYNKSEVLARVVSRREDRVRRLQTISLSGDNRDRISAIKTANDVDDSMIKLMQDIGTIPRNLGTMQVRDETVKVYDKALIDELTGDK